MPRLFFPGLLLWSREKINEHVTVVDSSCHSCRSLALQAKVAEMRPAQRGQVARRRDAEAVSSWEREVQAELWFDSKVFFQFFFDIAVLNMYWTANWKLLLLLGRKEPGVCCAILNSLKRLCETSETLWIVLMQFFLAWVSCLLNHSSPSTS